MSIVTSMCLEHATTCCDELTTLIRLRPGDSPVRSSTSALSPVRSSTMIVSAQPEWCGCTFDACSGMEAARMRKKNKKPIRRKIVLRLPDLDHSKICSAQ